MGRNKIVKSLSLSPGTLELCDAIIDMYGLGEGMTSQLADAVLHKAFGQMAEQIAMQTATGVKFKLDFELEFEEGS